jgi:ABC-2 type transport system ATP-binding protein
VLLLKELSRRFGETVALDRLTLEVPAGELVGFVGPNGAGKTTAMRIGMGVLEPDAGEVLWQDAPVTREAQRGFGYMPEERGLYPKMRVDRHLRYLAGLHGKTPRDAQAAADGPLLLTHRPIELPAPDGVAVASDGLTVDVGPR